MSNNSFMNVNEADDETEYSVRVCTDTFLEALCSANRPRLTKLERMGHRVHEFGESVISRLISTLCVPSHFMCPILTLCVPSSLYVSHPHFMCPILTLCVPFSLYVSHSHFVSHRICHFGFMRIFSFPFQSYRLKLGGFVLFG